MAGQRALSSYSFQVPLRGVLGTSQGSLFSSECKCIWGDIAGNKFFEKSNLRCNSSQPEVWASRYVRSKEDLRYIALLWQVGSLTEKWLFLKLMTSFSR